MGFEEAEEGEEERGFAASCSPADTDVCPGRNG